MLVADYLDFGCIALAVLSGLQAQHSAISKLNDRIRQVLGYITAVKAGETAWDHEAMRQIQTVVANLPQTILPELQEELLRVSVTTRELVIMATLLIYSRSGPWSSSNLDGSICHSSVISSLLNSIDLSSFPFALKLGTK